MADTIAAAITANLEFRAVGQVDDIIERLECVGRLDESFTRKEKFWFGWVIGLGILFIASIIVAFFSAGRGLIAAVPIGAVFGLCIWKWRQRSRLNVQDRRHKIPIKLLKYLRTDIPPDQPISLSIDFRHYRSADFLKEQAGGLLASIKQWSYEIPWLVLAGQFYDGSKFRLKITQTAKRKEKQKRKTKKITETFRDKYNLTFSVKPQRYPGLSNFEQLIRAAQPPLGMATPTAKVIGNRVIVQGITHSEKICSMNSTKKDPLVVANAHAALQLFLACYHCLGQCRKT